MSGTAWGDFVFAQSRLQARHAALLETESWEELEQIGDYGQFLQSVRQTPLAALVQSFGALTPIDDMEIALRGAFADHVKETASWLPERWQPAVLFVCALPLLPFHRYLDAHAPFEWMANDPGMEESLSRRGTDQATGKDTGNDGGNDMSAARRWTEDWRRLWAEEVSGLDAVGDRMTAAARPDLGDGAPWPRRRAEVREWLRRAVRRYAFEPGAAFAHLGLVLLELGRLRGNLSARRSGLVA